MLVSSFMSRGVSHEVFQLALSSHTVLTGELNLRELRRVLAGKFEVPNELIAEFEFILRERNIVKDSPLEVSFKIRDPDDEGVLAAAMSCRAVVLVTGDQDLLECADKVAIRICSPRQLWQMLQ